MRRSKRSTPVDHAEPLTDFFKLAARTARVGMLPSAPPDEYRPPLKHGCARKPLRDARVRARAAWSPAEAERDRRREGLGLGPVRLREESGQRRARVDDLLFDPLDGGVAPPLASPPLGGVRVAYARRRPRWAAPPRRSAAAGRGAGPRRPRH